MVNATEDTELEAREWEQFILYLLRTEPRWATHLYTAVMSCIFVIAVIGNLLTCIVIYKDKTMHTVTNFYLFNLAISDLIVTFAILLEVYEGLFDTDRIVLYALGELACQIHFFLIMTLWNNGVLILTALAVERYIAICRPLTLKSVPVRKRVTKVIVWLWIVAIAESLPEVWSVNLTKNKKASMCFTVPTQFARYLNGVLAVLCFIIPLGIMVFVYSMIAFKIHVTQRDNGRHKIFNHRDSRSKVNKLIALTLSFMVCWLPFFSARVIIFVSDMKQIMAIDTWWLLLYKLIGVNSWFSAVLNPLLFSLMSTKFRKALKALWNKNLKVNRPETCITTTVV